MGEPTVPGLQSAAYHLCWLVGSEHPGEAGAALRDAAELLGPSDLPVEPVAFEASARRLLWMAFEDFDATQQLGDRDRVEAALDLLTGAAEPIPPLKTARVLELVAAERRRQDAKWGVQNHDPFVWMSILTEEVGEAAKAALELRFAPFPTAPTSLLGLAECDATTAARKAALRTELVQTAASAVAAIEALDRGAWTWGNHGR